VLSAKNKDREIDFDLLNWARRLAEINNAEADVNLGLSEVNALIERLRAKKNTRS
jgi:hypothetical protein